jgi:hypothetical protein
MPPTVSNLTQWKSVLSEVINATNMNVGGASSLVTGVTYFRVRTRNPVSQQILFSDVIAAGTGYVASADNRAVGDPCSRWNYFLSSLSVALITKDVSSIQFIRVPTYNVDISTPYIEANAITCSFASPNALIARSMVFPALDGNQSFSCFDATKNSSYTWSVGATTSGKSCVGLGIPERQLYFAPCSQACTSNSWLPDSNDMDELILLHILFVPKSVPLAITSIVSFNSSRTAVTLSISLCCNSVSSLAAANLVTCTTAAAPPTSVEGVVRLGTSSWSRGNAVSVTLTSLQPSTNYSVYCTTMTSTGIYGSFDNVLSTSARVATKCCKSVSATLTAKTLYAGTLASNVLSISLGVLPTASVTLWVKAFQNGAVLTSSFYPSSITVSHNSVSSTALFSAVGFASTGSVTVAAYLTGESASEFGGQNTSVPFESGYNSVSVISSIEIPDAVELYKAIFAPTGTFVRAYFTGPTDQGGLVSAYPFLCSKILVFSRSDEYMCQWAADGVSVTVIMGLNAALAPGAVVSVTAGSIRPACPSGASKLFCATFSPSLPQNISVQAPVTPNLPVVLISAASVLGSCDDLVLDITSSAGSLGRKWRSVTFQVFSSDPNVTVIENYLNANYTVYPPTPLPSSLLAAFSSYAVTVTVCNYLSSCGSASHQFVVVSSVVSSVAFAGGVTQSVLRKNNISVSALGSYTQCSSTDTRSYPTSYVWQIVRTSTREILPLASVSRDVTKYSLGSFSLDSLSLYSVSVVFTVYVSVTNTLSSAASTQIYVSQGALIAVISNGASQSLRLGEKLTLEATDSYDEDLPRSSVSVLKFVWECVDVAPVYGVPCWMQYQTVTQSSSQLLVSTPSVQAANTSFAQHSSQFTVTVRDTISVRSSSALVTVTVLPGKSAVVTIPQLSQALVPAWTSLVVKAKVAYSSDSSGYCSWSADDSTLNLANVSLTGVVNAITASSSGSSLTQTLQRQFSLVLLPNTLPVRSTVRFTLTCGVTTTSGILLSSSFIDVTTLSPPSPGSFSLAPLFGKELETDFSLHASYWDDISLPLSYAFGYFDTFSGLYSPLSTRMYTPHVVTQLPAGPLVRNFMLECYVMVFNAFNANSTVTEAVVVQESETLSVTSASGVVEVLNSISSTVSANTHSVDASVHTHLLTVYSTLLNRVNCSVAPNCTALHRSPCSVVPNTCSGCLKGALSGTAGSPLYISTDEYSNEPCMAINAIAASRLESGSVCLFDEDCAGWFKCNTTLMECYAPQKVCSDVDTCSGKGKCYYVDTRTGYPLSSCLTGFPSCSTACLCVANYSGQHCELSVAQAVGKIASRALLAQALSNLTLIQDVDAFTALSWANSLRSITQMPAELNDDTHSTISVVAADLLAVGESGAVVFYDTTIGAISETIDSLARSPLMSETTNNTGFLTFVGRLSNIVSGVMVEGQTQTSLRLSNYRLSTDAYVSAFDGASVAPKLVLPLSPYETVSGSRSTSAQLLFSSNISSAVSLIGFKESLFMSASPALASFNKTSSPLRLIIDESLCGSTAGTSNNNTYDVRFVLAHNNYVSFGLNLSAVSNGTEYAANVSTSVQHVVSCVLGQRGNFTFSCPRTTVSDVINTSYTCDGSGAMSYVIQCPVSLTPKHQLVPACNVVMNGVVLPPAACTVLNYSSWHTECGCTLCNTFAALFAEDDYADDDFSGRLRLQRPAGRRLSSLNGNNMVDIASTSIIVSSEQFATVMSNPESLFSQSGITHVLHVLILLLCIWVGLPMLLCFGALRNSFGGSWRVANKMHRRGSIATFVTDKSGINAANVLLDYANSILPEIFQPQEKTSRRSRHSKSLVGFITRCLCSCGFIQGDGILARCWREFMVNVPLLVLLCGRSKKIRDSHMPLLVLKMLTVVTFSLFVLAFFFTLQYPTDDGTCSAQSTTTACTSKTSFFDRQVPLCVWTNGSTGVTALRVSDTDSVSATLFPHCEYLRTDFNLQVSTLICILVVLVTTPVLFVIEHIFADVLFAPTSADINTTTDAFAANISKYMQTSVQAQMQHVGQRVRRASIDIKTSIQSFVAKKGDANAVVDGNEKGRKLQKSIFKQSHKTFERNILMKPELMSTRFKAVQLCSDLPIFRQIALKIGRHALVQTSDHLWTIGSHKKMSALTSQSGSNLTGVCVNLSDLSGDESARFKMKSPAHKKLRSLRNSSSPFKNSYKTAVMPILEHSNSNNSSMGASRTQTVIKDMLKDLVTDLSACRRQLQYACEFELFDEAWGVECLDPHGRCVLLPAAQLIIQHEHMFARTLGQRALTHMNSLNRGMCGAELMKMYFMDMMGTSSEHSHILAQTIAEHVLQQKRTVTWSMKCLVVCVLVLLNLFFLYVCLLYAAQRDSAWQRAWVLNSLLNVFVELIFAPMLETFVLCVLVPATIVDSVEEARKEIAKQARRLCDRRRFGNSTAHNHEEAEMDRADTEEDDDFDSLERKITNIYSKYFFASRVVAEQRPDLIESTLVYGFETQFPFNLPHLRHKLEDIANRHRRQQLHLLQRADQRLQRSGPSGFSSNTLADAPMPPQENFGHGPPAVGPVEGSFIVNDDHKRSILNAYFPALRPAGGGNHDLPRAATTVFCFNSVSLSAVCVVGLRYLGTCPFAMQRFCLQLTQPLFIGSFGFSFSALINKYGTVTSTCLLVLCVFGLLFLAVYWMHSLYNKGSNFLNDTGRRKHKFTVVPHEELVGPLPQHHRVGNHSDSDDSNMPDHFDDSQAPRDIQRRGSLHGDDDGDSEAASVCVERNSESSVGSLDGFVSMHKLKPASSPNVSPKHATHSLPPLSGFFAGRRHSDSSANSAISMQSSTTGYGGASVLELQIAQNNRVPKPRVSSQGHARNGNGTGTSRRRKQQSTHSPRSDCDAPSIELDNLSWSASGQESYSNMNAFDRNESAQSSTNNIADHPDLRLKADYGTKDHRRRVRHQQYDSDDMSSVSYSVNRNNSDNTHASQNVYFSYPAADASAAAASHSGYNSGKSTLSPRSPRSEDEGSFIDNLGRRGGSIPDPSGSRRKSKDRYLLSISNIKNGHDSSSEQQISARSDGSLNKLLGRFIGGTYVGGGNHSSANSSPRYAVSGSSDTRGDRRSLGRRRSRKASIGNESNISIYSHDSFDDECMGQFYTAENRDTYDEEEAFWDAQSDNEDTGHGDDHNSICGDARSVVPPMEDEDDLYNGYDNYYCEEDNILPRYAHDRWSPVLSLSAVPCEARGGLSAHTLAANVAVTDSLNLGSNNNVENLSYYKSEAVKNARAADLHRINESHEIFNDDVQFDLESEDDLLERRMTRRQTIRNNSSEYISAASQHAGTIVRLPCDPPEVGPVSDGEDDGSRSVFSDEWTVDDGSVFDAVSDDADGLEVRPAA